MGQGARNGDRRTVDLDHYGAAERRSPLDTNPCARPDTALHELIISRFRSGQFDNLSAAS
jgi:hypothetical protein